MILSGESGLATVVGLSTEGYSIASTLIQNGVETIIVDENLQMGMKLTPEVAAAYGSVNNLLEGETLVSVEPMDTSISRAEYIFFTPKIRKTYQEAKAEVNKRFRDTVKHLSEKSIIIFCLPVGFNENRANITLIESMSGLKPDEDFRYIYAPLKPRTKTPMVVGLEKKTSGKTTAIFKQAGMKSPQPTTLETAEIVYFRHILADYLSMALDLEVYKKEVDRDERIKMKKMLGYKEAYLDTLTENLFDVRLVLGTLDTGDPSLYLTSGVLKSVDGYVKYLVDEIRRVMREKGLKASKTKVTLAWSVDKYEMRGVRLAALGAITERLHDYIGDVNILNGGQYVSQAGIGFGGIMPDVNKTDIVMICSKQDYKYATKVFNLENERSGAIVLKADLIVDYYR